MTLDKILPGTIEVKLLDGNTYKFRHAKFVVTREIEKKYGSVIKVFDAIGIDFKTLMRLNDGEKVSVSEIMQMVWGKPISADISYLCTVLTQKDHPDMTEDKMDELLDMSLIGDVIIAVIRCLLSAIPDISKNEPVQTAEKAKA